MTATLLEVEVEEGKAVKLEKIGVETVALTLVLVVVYVL